MIRSRLFIKVYLAIVFIILLLGVAVYTGSVPYIEHTAYTLEREHAHQTLNEVYELVKDIAWELEDHRRHAVDARKVELRHLMELAEALVHTTLSSGLEESQARQQLFTQLRKFTYGNKDYFWISDYTSRLISHPDEKLHNHDSSDLRDVNNKLIVPPMVEIARRDGEGFYSYQWQRLGQKQPSEKISYFRDFPEYGFILGTGIYLDDIEENLAQLRQEKLRNLREQLHKIKINRTGYVYIFDKNYNIIIHPNPVIEGQNSRDFIDPSTGKLLFSELVSSVGNPDGYTYKFDHPDDQKNYTYEKISWLKYFQEFGWYIGASVYKNELRASARELGTRLLAIDLAALIISLGLGWIFAKRLTDPINELAVMAKRIADGDLSARSTICSNDEIGVLANVFNTMIEQLRDHIGNLDINVKKRTAELEEAYQKLQKVERIKSELISSISHELRTPLTSIQGYAKLLKKDMDKFLQESGEKTPKLQKNLDRAGNNLQIILLESKRLSDLITHVIEISLIQSGETEWCDETINLAEVIAAALERVRPTLMQKPALLFEQENKYDITLFIDRAKLTILVTELLDNAIKFSNNGVIRLIVEATDDQITISIIDQGIGIPADRLEDIFGHFTQITNEIDSLINKPPGAGLGLALCQDIVTHYNGRIDVESTLGKGSCFRVILPAKNLIK